MTPFERLNKQLQELWDALRAEIAHLSPEEQQRVLDLAERLIQASIDAEEDART